MMKQKDFISKLKEIYHDAALRLVIDYKSSDRAIVGYIHHCKAHIKGLEAFPIYFRGISATGAIYLTDSADDIITRLINDIHSLGS